MGVCNRCLLCRTANGWPKACMRLAISGSVPHWHDGPDHNGATCDDKTEDDGIFIVRAFKFPATFSWDQRRFIIKRYMKEQSGFQ